MTRWMLAALVAAQTGMGAAYAQSAGASAAAGQAAPWPQMKLLQPTSGHDITNAALIDREEVRVLRVDVAAGGVRHVHTHDDVRFHLFIPIDGRVRLQVGDAAPVEVGPWQTTFIPGGTRHGFTSVGPATVQVMEVFVKKPAR